VEVFAECLPADSMYCTAWHEWKLATDMLQCYIAILPIWLHLPTHLNLYIIACTEICGFMLFRSLFLNQWSVAPFILNPTF